VRNYKLPGEEQRRVKSEEIYGRSLPKRGLKGGNTQVSKKSTVLRLRGLNTKFAAGLHC
jgi:hypothetical protein